MNLKDHGWKTWLCCDATSWYFSHAGNILKDWNSEILALFSHDTWATGFFIRSPCTASCRYVFFYTLPVIKRLTWISVCITLLENFIKPFMQVALPTIPKQGGGWNSERIYMFEGRLHIWNSFQPLSCFCSFCWICINHSRRCSQQVRILLHASMAGIENNQDSHGLFWRLYPLSHSCHDKNTTGLVILTWHPVCCICEVLWF